MGVVRFFGHGISALSSMEGKPMLKPGDPAPDFSAQDHTGKTVALKDFKGRTLVMWFFPKADTPG